MAIAKLVIVSNRLPVQLVCRDNKWQTSVSSGGLASALGGLGAHLVFDWIGWPGEEVPAHDQEAVRAMLYRDHRCYPVFLSETEIDRFYNGFSNSVLWPLFHYLPSRVDFSLRYWREYQIVNEKFAQAVLAHCDDQSLVWIHDYQLLLLPSLLRQAKPKLKIGFFLHIPFPSSEMYRLLPVRREILEGLLGSNLIGFQTHDYQRHFTSTCLRVLGLDSTPSEIKLENRRVNLGTYPIGIDPAHFLRQLETSAAHNKYTEFKTAHVGKKLILGVDRLDYIKGLLLKLNAYEAFLENNPGLRQHTVMLQVAVPSRGAVRDYQTLKTDIDEAVGRINGRFGTPNHTPLIYMAQSVEFEALCALYALADVLLVTSIRDGMNLVSSEYAVCQKDGAGVLVLSEFAGAASLFPQSLIINPWDAQGVATALVTALTMSDSEKRDRARHNFEQAKKFTSLNWARSFVHDLKRCHDHLTPEAVNLKHHYVRLCHAYTHANNRILFLDYDGTLRDYVPNPQDAVPSPELLALLKRLCRDANTRVYLISGRAQSQLDAWFGAISRLGLSAEHGMSLKLSEEHHWQTFSTPSTEWMDAVRPILEDYVRQTPQTFIEEKKTSLVWHYRKVEDPFGEWQANELALHLEQSLANFPVEVMHGKKIIEVRSQGMNKGTLITHLLSRYPADSLILCFGDDRTDEDMFQALPASAWSCKVGSSKSYARLFLDTPQEVIDLLEELSSIPARYPALESRRAS